LREEHSRLKCRSGEWARRRLIPSSLRVRDGRAQDRGYRGIDQPIVLGSRAG